jgi:hypothetical protein
MSSAILLPPSLSVHWSTLETLASSLAAIRPKQCDSLQRAPQPSTSTSSTSSLSKSLSSSSTPLTANGLDKANHSSSGDRVATTNQEVYGHVPTAADRLLSLCPRLALHDHDRLLSSLIVNSQTRHDSMVALLSSLSSLPSSSHSSITVTEWFSSYGSNASVDDRALTALLAFTRYVSSSLLSYDYNNSGNGYTDMLRYINRIIVYIVNLPYLQWQSSNRKTVRVLLLPHSIV